MAKWLSDEEIEVSLPVFGDPTVIVEVFDQAKEANRLREKVETLKEALKESADLYEAASAEPCWCGDPNLEPECPHCDKASKAQRIVSTVLGDE